MSTTPGKDPRADERQKGIATTVTEVSERASLLIREEIELAKVEVTEKATKLIKGAIVGAAAGVFFLMALVFALVGCAWLLYYYLPVGDFAYFWGFFAMAVILVLLGALAGFIAAKAVKKGTPPTPSMAIEEARKIRETVSSGSGAGSSSESGSRSGVGSRSEVGSGSGAGSPGPEPGSPGAVHAPVGARSAPDASEDSKKGSD